jgi:predicted transcriptional regulator of viral defense system
LNYPAFHKAFKDRDLIPVNDIFKRFPDFDRDRLVAWQEKGYIQKVLNRFYVWADQAFDEGQLYFVANRIYTPSYVSLKSALHWYGFIPEGVYQCFSISTRKTITFESPIGQFDYKHIKPAIYFGYRPMEQKRGGFLIAEPEKAILDSFYLYTYLNDEADIDGLRLNYDEITARCSLEKLQRYADQINNKRVSRLTTILVKKLQHD